MRSLFMISSVIVLATAMPRISQAQSCNGVAASGATCTQQVTATSVVNTVARLSISSATTALVAPRASDFGTPSGVTSTNPITITVASNARYTLTASAAAATWTFTGPSAASKPASDLRMRVGTAGTVVPLGQVGTSTAGTGGTSFDVYYNTLYNFTTDKPGSYSLVVNYTLTAP